MQALGAELRRLKKEDPEKLAAVLSQLSEKEAHAIVYDPDIWLNPEQVVKDEWPEPIIMFMCGRGAGKLMGLETPILTKEGWKLLSEIAPGDYVYTEKGTLTRVLGVFDETPTKAYQLEFSDNSVLDVGEEHLWVTWTHQDRKTWNRNNDAPLPDDWVNWSHNYLDRWGNTKYKIGPKVRSTQDIVDSFKHGKRGDLNHSVPTTEAIHLPEEDWGIDPWLYGYWLGDGTHTYPSFTVGEEDKPWLVEKLLSMGYEVNSEQSCPKRVSLVGARDYFTGLLCSHKEVPDRFFKGSIEQRIGLLRGLMDSDGYADRKKNNVEFSAKNDQHADLVMWLVRSLGEKPVLKKKMSKLNGKDCGLVNRVTWRPVKVNPFSLPRKKNLISLDADSRHYHRMITKFTEIPVRPMRCLAVDSPNHLFLAGESLIPTHNTFLGSQWLRKKVRKGVKGQIALISPTASEVRDTIVLNTLIPLSDPIEEAPEYEPSKSRVVWKNGAVAKMFSAEHGEERIRGSNNELIWFDELGSIPNKDVFDQAMLTLRVGESRCLITTTPRPTPTIIDLYKRAVFNDDPSQEGKDVRIISFPTYNNFDNLSDAFKNTIIKSYEGTRLAQQELEGKLLLDSEGALWNTDLIIQQTLGNEETVPALEKVCIGVDPAVSTGKHSDKTGIVVVGLGEDEHAYVLHDATDSYTPQGWASKVHNLYDYYREQGVPVTVVVERNQGGNLVKDTLSRDRPFIPFSDIFSSKSKIARAEPIAMLYEQGKIFHVKSFTDLEQEMCGYEGKSRQKSPDRLDALVFALTEIMPSKKSVTKSFSLFM